MAENTSKLGDINKASLDSIRAMLDANTIVGDPIQTASGTCIIPISKISVGYASGGVDYAKKDAGNTQGKTSANNFGGGGGTGLSISPVAFLVISADGSAEMLNINNVDTRPNNIVESLTDMVERAPEIISKIKSVVGSKKSDESEDILGDNESTDVTEA